MSVLSAEVTWRLDASGDFRVLLPLTDPRTKDAQIGRIWQHFREGEGLVFAGLIESVAKTPEESLEISGPTILSELLYKNTLLNRQYSETAINTIVDDLLKGEGWTRQGSVATPVTIRFDGESKLKGVIDLLRQQGLHLREEVTESGGILTKQAEIGAFGASSGIIATGGHPDDLILNDPSLAFVDRVSVEEVSSEIWNWVLPLGAGEGTTQLTLGLSTRTSPYRILKIAGPDGKTIFFLADFTVWDGFQRANAAIASADTGQAWTAAIGTWNVLSNQGRASALVGGQAIAVIAAGTADGRVGVRLAIVNANDRLIFRYSGTADYLFVAAEAAAYTLNKRVAGVESQLDTYAVTPAANDELVVVLAGNDIDVLLNGTVILRATDSFNNTATSHGLQTANIASRFDNFFVAGAATSIAAYGQRQRPFVAKDIAPLSATKVALQAAANALYDLAAAQLNLWKLKQTAYRLTIRELSTAVDPGDKVRLRYRGFAEHWDVKYAYLDINADLWVLERHRSFAEGGEETSDLVVSDLDRPLQDNEVTIGKLEETARAFRTHIQTSVSNSSQGPILEEVNSTHPMNWDEVIQDNVVQLLRCKLRLKPRAIRSTATGAASGGGQTSSTEASHTHTVADHTHTTPNHTHGLSGITTDSGGASTSGTTGHRHKVGELAATVAWADPTHKSDLGTVQDPGGGSDVVLGRASADSTARIFNTATETPIHSHTTPDHSHSFTAQTTNSGGGSTSGSGGGQTSSAGVSHSHTVAAHTHTQVYGIFEGTSAAGITVTIDGVDRTAALGGPWSAAASLDITQYLLDSDGVVVQGVHTMSLGSTALGRIEAWIDRIEVVAALVAT